MRSPPTLPRRRGRLQPDPKCCGLAIDGLTAESSANMGGRSFARPQAGFAARRDTTCGRPSVAFPRLPARRTSVAQETVDILRLVEIFGGVKTGSLNKRPK